MGSLQSLTLILQGSMGQGEAQSWMSCWQGTCTKHGAWLGCSLLLCLLVGVPEGLDTVHLCRGCL